MSRPLAVLRPEPGWSATAAAARNLRLTVIGHPVLQAEPLAWTPPDGPFHALLAGSAATFRLGGERLAELAHLPVHAVGQATAAAAREAGFAVEQTGEGGLQALLDASEGKSMRFLRLGGEERVELAPHPGQVMVESAVYRMRPLPLEAGFAAELARGEPIVALHSAAATRQFAAEVGRLDIRRGQLSLVALGPRIAAAAGSGWAALDVAERPADAALLAKAAALCN